MMRGVLPSLIQGLPKAASTCWWLVGRNPWFQLELFQFESPLARPLPADFRPCDTGYTRIGLWVADFDATLSRLQQLGTLPLRAPVGPRDARRVCVRSPDGVYVEIMEDDPLVVESKGVKGRHDCAAAIRSVTMSTPDLADSVDYLSRGIGLKESRVALHAPEHEAMWGLAGAQTRSRLFEAGDVLVEVVQYLNPVGKPWPKGYRISDQGILNIAFGARNKRDHMEVYRRAAAFGARPNCRPIHTPGAGVVYVNDRHRFSVEILWMKPGSNDRQWGFEPLPTARRPAPDTHAVRGRVHIDADVQKVWDVIADHEGMTKWSGFSPVSVVRDGDPERNGYGSERRMQGPPGVGVVVEQVIATHAPDSVRYRTIRGSPFVCHQGEIRLAGKENATDLNWTIRFRSRIPGLGWLFRRVLASRLNAMLTRQLKPYIESMQAP
jgi:catechol 2,3-dioxygenase-like lactoylglutathione lyase family enzyme/uncharacterized protein YndB with AHSA1/START domain